MSRLEQLTEPLQPQVLAAPEPDQVQYPESDGLPMADNTRQFNWIVSIKLNLEERFASHPEVFVAGDLLWYPVEGRPKIRQAPDVLVAIGRPKGDRGSYLQWKEAGVAPQVMFEVLSPGNTASEMTRKFEFYERYGVEEYYLIDPDRLEASGWVRSGERLESVEEINGWEGPRLGIRFEVEAGSRVELFHPGGRSFEDFVEVVRERDQQRERAETAEVRAETAEVRAETAEVRAETAEVRAEQESQARAKAQAQAEQESQARAEAQARAEQESQARAKAQAQAERLRQKLLELGIDPNSV